MGMPGIRPFTRPGSERSIWTVADLEQLPDDGNRYEIRHGELLVTPRHSNGHQGGVGRQRDRHRKRPPISPTAYARCGPPTSRHA